MIRLHETRTVSAPVAEAFDYAANFENIQDWDPGVVTSQRVGDGPVAVGSAFDLVTVFKGRESDMPTRSPNSTARAGSFSRAKESFCRR